MKLSVILITRNDITHIARSVTSVTNQLTDDVELIVVDDASTDGTDEVARKLVDGVQNATVHKRDVCGNIGAARNTGASIAYGDYIYFMDSDDYITEGAIKRILDVIAKSDVDVVTVPVACLFQQGLKKSAVPAKNLEESAFGAVGAWAQVIRRSLYVPTPENMMCEDAAWHYEQWDKFSSWAKVEGDEPVYVWDRTNAQQITKTVEWCNANSITLEALATSNVLVKAGLKDKWVSDNLRNIANMYDVRHKIKKPHVMKAWYQRFQSEVMRMMSGHHTH